MSPDNIDLPQKGAIVFLKWTGFPIRRRAGWADDPYIIVDYIREWEDLNPYYCKIYNVKSGIMRIASEEKVRQYYIIKETS